MSRPLVVRLCNYIGDVVLGLPALKRLADAGYQIHVYGPGWASKLLSGTGWTVHGRAKKLGQRIHQLRALHHQLSQAHGLVRVQALAMPNSFSSALELRLAGFAVSGYARDGRTWLLSQAISAQHGPHAADGFWSLSDALLGEVMPRPALPWLPIQPEAAAEAEALIASWTDAREGFVCIAPFAGGLVDKKPKRWPEFPDFVRQLAGCKLPIIVCPGPAEVEEAQAHYAVARSVTGLPLDVYAAVLARSKLVVANDTGPAHMAAAVGAPVLSVLGHTRVAQWRPWGPQVHTLGGDGRWPSMAEVVSQTEALLNRPLTIQG